MYLSFSGPSIKQVLYTLKLGKSDIVASRELYILVKIFVSSPQCAKVAPL